MIAPIVARLTEASLKAGVVAELLVNVDNEALTGEGADKDEKENHAAWAELSYSSKGFVVPVFRCGRNIETQVALE